MLNEIRLCGKKYEIIDAIEYITLADSFVTNKIGKGNGEAKLYVGNENERLINFFGDFNSKCFFVKKDFLTFLRDSESEYTNPQQEYRKKDKLQAKHLRLIETAEMFNTEILRFELFRAEVKPPRVYVNSKSPYYNFMRQIGLPNISYLSVLKLKKENDEIVYYFKMFIDYKSDMISYAMPEEKIQTELIESWGVSEKKKMNLIQARIGQGEYRNKLLEECPFCPFTMINDERLLIASHIKPWAKADEKEKIDPKNGFVFTPTFDKLFDKGFITFDENKHMIVSPWISPLNQKRLGIYTGKIIEKLPLDDKRREYLNYHREKIYKG